MIHKNREHVHLLPGYQISKVTPVHCLIYITVKRVRGASFRLGIIRYVNHHLNLDAIAELLQAFYPNNLSGALFVVSAILQRRWDVVFITNT